MTDQVYEVGDWVVHRSYGLGQVRSIESRPIGGRELPCYRIKTRNGTYWAATESVDNPRIRPLTARKQLKRALQELEKPPGWLERNYRAWRERIKKVRSEGRMMHIARVIRDLTAKSNLKKLNDFESQALRDLSEQFMLEWSVSMGLEMPTVRNRFNQLLNKIELVEN